MYTKFKERWLKEQEKTINQYGNLDNDTVASIKNKNVSLWKRLNKDGLTPLTLAAKLGITDMFSFLLNESKIVQWRYGSVSCVLYPLDELEYELQEVSV
jgi:hypothetical protein